MTTPTRTLDALIEWLEQKPGDQRFYTRSVFHCPVGAWVNEGRSEEILLLATDYAVQLLSGAAIQYYADDLCAFVAEVDALYGGMEGVITAAEALAIARRVREGQP